MAENVHFLERAQKPGTCPLEQAFLATCLLTPKALDLLPEGFGSHHLEYDGHGEIFEAVKLAAARGVPVLLPLVKAAVPRFAAPGGYIDELVKAYEIADLRGFRGYAEAIMEEAVRRDLVALADTIKRDALAQGGERMPTAALLTRASVEFDRLVSGQPQGRKAVYLIDAVDEAIAAGEEAAERGDGLAGISTGLRCIDRRLGGLEADTLTILAGRPGMAKTSLAAQIALHVAENVGPVLFVSQEMAARQIGRRVLSQKSRVSGEALRSGAFTRCQRSMQAISEARRDLRLRFAIEDEPALSIDAVRHRVKAAMRRMDGLALVVVDHLQLMGRPESAARFGDTHAITELSRGSKRMAKEFGIPVLSLSQLSRGVEERDDKRPRMSDMRQSGAIEEDADSVMMLYREEVYARKEKVERRVGETGEAGDKKYYERVLEHRGRLDRIIGRAEILFEKVREGEAPVVEELGFDGALMRFFEEGERA